MDIFAVPVLDKVLIYAPLHQLLALVDRAAARLIQRHLYRAIPTGFASLQPILSTLEQPALPIPQARRGPLQEPLFLGLIPTRGCNLGCRYCDFALPKQKEPVMPFELARQAVEAYFQLLVEHNQPRGEVHFFGGEPFFAEEVVHFVVNFARLRAAQLGLQVRFEVTTNGLYSAGRSQWIADHFDTVVLSLDGPADIQELHRPALNGRPVHQVVERSARIFSDGAVELILRACVTSQTVERLPEIAAWLGQHFRPSTVTFESLTESPLSLAAGLTPPDPWEFARQFCAAARLLEPQGIQVVLSSANLHTLQASFCPVGKDALIVSPDGRVDACYLPAQEWERNGLDLRLGRLAGGRLEIDPQALQRARQLTVHEKPLCAGCLCRYHCAGGCHVNHHTNAAPGQYDTLCLQTRLITIASLLRQLGQDELAAAWLADRQAMQASAWQAGDALSQLEVSL